MSIIVWVSFLGDYDITEEVLFYMPYLVSPSQWHLKVDSITHILEKETEAWWAKIKITCLSPRRVWLEVAVSKSAQGFQLQIWVLNHHVI